jgi:hypothetical protein
MERIFKQTHDLCCDTCKVIENNEFNQLINILKQNISTVVFCFQ